MAGDPPRARRQADRPRARRGRPAQEAVERLLARTAPVRGGSASTSRCRSSTARSASGACSTRAPRSPTCTPPRCGKRGRPTPRRRSYERAAAHRGGDARGAGGGAQARSRRAGRDRGDRLDPQRRGAAGGTVPGSEGEWISGAHMESRRCGRCCRWWSRRSAASRRDRSAMPSQLQMAYAQAVQAGGSDAPAAPPAPEAPSERRPKAPAPPRIRPALGPRPVDG